ncbi:hypothetical protein ACFYNY_16970 [Streptomyces sp. NPDC006530]|uniref:hypothetical protein n=1 Tax=Streptomyces sp. NPDC006530 TaxID=3364750 RepID=UPI003685611F
MSSTAATLNPSIIGQAEKHHAAILTRALAGTALDEKQWITLNQALAAGAPVERNAHVARISGLTQWATADVEMALAALIESGLAQPLPDSLIEVTDDGRALAGKVRAETGAVLDRAYSSVPPEELAAAARTLATITARMAEELTRP